MSGRAKFRRDGERRLLEGGRIWAEVKKQFCRKLKNSVPTINKYCLAFLITQGMQLHVRSGPFFLFLFYP